MKIRRATEADIPRIMAIRFAVRENVLSDPTKVTPQHCIDYLDRLGRGWVCELVGWADKPNMQVSVPETVLGFASA